MERKYIIYESNIKVDVVEAKADTTMDVQISVLGDPAFNKKRFEDYHDEELEAQGWTRLALVNGSLFFSEGTQTYANGVEKSMGIVNENDDSAWDKNMGFYHGNGVPYIYEQGYIKTLIDKPEVRGAITAAFGLINNGVKDISGAYYGEPSVGIYNQKSGRTIVGKKGDGTIVMATFDGTTGSTGLTGDQTVQLAFRLGLRNAVCMDGGGSTFLLYKTTIYNNSLREGANAVAIYIRPKVVTDPWAGSKVSLGSLTVEKSDGSKVYIKELQLWVDISAVVKVA